jgi:pyruvate formate lyase activating enzyme
LLYVRDHIQNNAPDTVLWIRTPLIPGATDTADNIKNIGAFIANKLAGTCQRWELLAFNNLCRDKYRRLGIDWQYAATPLMTKETLLQMENYAKQSGINADIVFATGPTKVED